MRKMLIIISMVFITMFVGCTQEDIDSDVTSALKSVKNYSHNYSATFVNDDKSEELVIFIVIEGEDASEVKSIIENVKFHSKYRKITVKIETDVDANSDEYKLIDTIIVK